MRIRLFDFHTYDEANKQFVIQMFGITAVGEPVCVLIDDFKPHFFVEIPHTSLETVDSFVQDIQDDSSSEIATWEVVKRKKLYGFSNGELKDFLYMEFENMKHFHQMKNLWYDEEKRLNPDGYCGTFLYESNIPPLLRFFHISKLSPSGWIQLTNTGPNCFKKTSCKYEFRVSSNDIIPLNECNDLAPFKICSFDIEASSSHGDFPVPIKSYKKLATNLVDHCRPVRENVIQACFIAFFEGNDQYAKVFPKETVTEQSLTSYLNELFETKTACTMG
jgi:DNA polymerase delta subunit 1